MTNNIIKNVLQIAAITTFFLGLAIVIFPHLIILWFEGYSAQNYHFVRFVGTALIGFAVTNWLYSKLTDLRYVLPAIYGNLTSIGLAILVDVIGLATHSLSKAAWLILVLHIIFAVAFSYCIRYIIKSNLQEARR